MDPGDLEARAPSRVGRPRRKDVRGSAFLVDQGTPERQFECPGDDRADGPAPSSGRDAGIRARGVGEERRILRADRCCAHEEGIGGVTEGVVDPSGWIPFTIQSPSLAQRLLYLMTVLPGLALIAEIARRMAHLLRAAQATDPFTASTARALVAVGKLTAFAGLGIWVLSQVAQGVLSWTMLVSPVPYLPHQTPLGWLAVGLIFAAFGQILDRGVAMRAELDTVI